MLIGKNPNKLQISKWPTYYYERARDALYDITSLMAKAGKLEHLILPAYIGWSPKEGSGIYDPIMKLEKLGVSHSFYRINGGLRIDIRDLYARLKNCRSIPKVLLIVNYFGFPDPNAHEIVREAHKHNVFVIEDNAHGMFTYLISGGIGADASFFSFHKMLPYDKGGSIIIKNEELNMLTLRGVQHDETPYKPWIYDLAEISLVRRNNYFALVDLINNFDYKDLFIFLYNKLPDDVSPQSLPVLINRGDRFAIYKRMNTEGFGVVSLYHTLIKPLNNSLYSQSVVLSRRILNLPVHQDVDTSLYPRMVELLMKYCRET